MEVFEFPTKVVVLPLSYLAQSAAQEHLARRVADAGRPNSGARNPLSAAATAGLRMALEATPERVALGCAGGRPRDTPTAPAAMPLPRCTAGHRAARRGPS